MIVNIIAEILYTLSNLYVLMPQTIIGSTFNCFVKKVDNRDLNVQMSELIKERNTPISKWYTVN